MSAWIPLFMNAGVAVLGAAQGADWLHIVGPSQAGTVAAVLAGLNALAHAVTIAGPAAKSS